MSRRVTVTQVTPIFAHILHTDRKVYLDIDLVYLDCRHAITLTPHEDDNLSLVGAETTCNDPHEWEN